jgi:heme O synthase-like polyprenyltransferase
MLLWLAWRQVVKGSIPGAMRLFHYSTTYLAILFFAMMIDRLLPL